MNWKVRQKNRKQSGRNRSRVKWKVTERESPSITKHRNVHSIMPRQRQYSLTVEREQTESLRYFRMDMGLSDVRIIFRGKMIFMYRLLRYADLTWKQVILLRGISVSKHRERNSVPCYMWPLSTDSIPVKGRDDIILKIWHRFFQMRDW